MNKLTKEVDTTKINEESLGTLDPNEPQELTLEAKEKGECALQNQNGETAGTVKKAKASFRFYNSGERFMGFIYPSGYWMPKLGINRREMRITPEQAQFSLDVFKANSSIK